MNGLTRAQQKVFNFVRENLNAGRPGPTLREIAKEFGFRSHRSAACHLDAIKRKGFLESDRSKARSLRLARDSRQTHRAEIAEVPLYGTIPAGFGEEIQQEADVCVTVEVETIGFKPTRTTFALKVVG